ncbi:lipid phosphate phosphatase 2 [Selaginella moellendorffii]|nr:lipid phosphate phosphatase 2 [Selaginella moellendorffii]XP_024541749.1 lipid phosphate phosphatase 2 [Selaginella moellendorffii]|eukprot:XP_002981022.2 lipid phosphate phosphatase 2 [Selaginella moellendorffii]
MAGQIRAVCCPLFRFHLHDWLAIIFLLGMEALLLVIHPFKRYIGEPMIDDYKFPFNNNTIPVAAVPVIALVIPLIFIIGYYIRNRDLRDLHYGFLGLLFAVLITAVLTDAIKDAVGRPRPDFFWRCFPDGIPLYTTRTREVMCTGDKADIREGYKSFPSGHTSWSFAGLGYLSLYLAGKICAFDRQGRVAKLIIVVVPLLGATLVGISRVDDYWHHWQDVFAGAIIGLTMAHICYRQHFPSVYDEYSFSPYPERRAPADWPPPRANGSVRDLENGRDVEISRL